MVHPKQTNWCVELVLSTQVSTAGIQEDNSANHPFCLIYFAHIQTKFILLSVYCVYCDSLETVNFVAKLNSRKDKI